MKKTFKAALLILSILSVCQISAMPPKSSANDGKSTITAKLMVDVANGKDHTLYDIRDGGEIPIQSLISHGGRGIYVGSSTNCDNLPYRISFMINDFDRASTQVQGIPQFGQECRESNNLQLNINGLNEGVICSMPEGIECDIAEDVKNDNDRRIAHIKNGTLLAFKDLLVGNRGIYIGGVRLANPISVNFKKNDGSDNYVIIKPTPLDGQGWRACNNIDFKWGKANSVTVNMDDCYTFDLAYDVKNGSDNTFRRGVSNNTTISKSDLTNKGSRFRPNRGVYSGPIRLKNGFTIKFLSQSTRKELASIYVSPTPQSGQTWRSSNNINFKARVQISNRMESPAEIIRHYAPHVVFASEEKYFPSSISEIKGKVRLYENVDMGKLSELRVSIKDINDVELPGSISISEDVKSGKDIGIVTVKNGDIISDRSVLEKMWDGSKPKYLGANSNGKVSDVLFYDKDNNLVSQVRCNNKPLDGQTWRASSNFCLGKVVLSNSNFNLLNSSNNTKYKGWYPTDEYNRNGDLGSAKVYVVVNANTDKELSFTYHFFYPYNGTNKLGANNLNHYGDWERFKVLINKQDKNKCTFTYYHHAESSNYKPDKIKGHNGHPVVYVAGETHAAYSSISIVDNPAAVASEYLGGGKEWETKNSIEIVTEDNTATKKNYEWIDWAGKWGHPIFHRN